MRANLTRKTLPLLSTVIFLAALLAAGMALAAPGGHQEGLTAINLHSRASATLTAIGLLISVALAVGLLIRRAQSTH